MRKVKSHRNLDTAKDLCDLWTIAGTHCADMAATAVLQNIPQTLQQISKKIATFQDHEGRMLTTVFQYLCEFNKARVQACASRDKERANHNRNLDQPKKPPERIVGVFDSEAMGGEAFVIMRDFNPPNYFSLQTEDVPDDTFQMCLQGANLGKALFVWARQLQWPQDYKEKDKNDWGMSWLELIFNFYITTGFNMPIRTGLWCKVSLCFLSEFRSIVAPQNQKSCFFADSYFSQSSPKCTDNRETRIFSTLSRIKMQITSEVGSLLSCGWSTKTSSHTTSR